MRACPACYALNDDDARFCAECQSPMLATPKGKAVSEASLAAAEARRRFYESAPSAADLTEQQWYNVCKHFPLIAKSASEFSHRALARVGAENPLDATSQVGPPIAFFLKRRGIREPGEDG